LPGTRPLPAEGDLSHEMVEAIDGFLERETARLLTVRQRHWSRDFSSAGAYTASVQPNRDRFRRYVGAVDTRPPVRALEFVASTASPADIAETDEYNVYAVRWPALDGVWGEGLLLQPKGKAVARVVAIPEGDHTPEMLVGLAKGIAPEAQFARRLAERGVEVIVPALIDRASKWSGNPAVMHTDKPHREWVYLQAYQMGRHIVGYEVQKVLAAIDWFASRPGALRTGVAGYGEGGLIAFYAAALDTRVDAVLVSGYFESRQRVWQEPIYRNVWGLLDEFGDAEIAGLIAPRALVVEHAPVPSVHHGGKFAAPGVWRTPAVDSVRGEFERARAMFPRDGPVRFRGRLIEGARGQPTGPGSAEALAVLLDFLEVPRPPLRGSPPAPADRRQNFDPGERQKRQVEQLVEHVQKLLRLAEYKRRDRWNADQAVSVAQWEALAARNREYFWNEVVGRMPDPSLPPNPRTRKIRDRAKWVGYEVVLDVWPGVFAWGYLLLPKDLQPGERRPVVICQHGLEGLPESVITEDPDHRDFRVYRAFAARLAERGFIVYAPHNPYRGDFRKLQRKANPLKKSLFSFIAGQHQQTLEWLAGLPFVDPARIGFYGLSYGGRTAVYVPPLLNRYALSISSGNFADWMKKRASVDDRHSGLYGNQVDLYDFDLGETYNHAEMAWMMAPRPFMVERGHRDDVALEEWGDYEYSKVRRLYGLLGIPERTAIEHFNGAHEINGIGTFEFLHRHLGWRKPQ